MEYTGPRELVACDLCGKDDPDHLITKNTFRVLRCRNCSLVYVSPRLVPQGLELLYDNESFCGKQIVRADDEDWVPKAEARRDLVDGYCPNRGRLLDVGCSAGWFMSVAAKSGWQVHGMDVSASAVAHSRSRGYEAEVATLETLKRPDEPFQAIVMFDSIEHMPSPMRALKIVHDLLDERGIVMITTPNVDGLLPKVTYHALAKPFGVWDHPGPPGHIYQFSQETLGEALRRSGFEVLRSETESIPLDFTVGHLEDTLIDVLKQRGKKHLGAGEEIPASTASGNGAANGNGAATPSASRGSFFSPKRVVRRVARTAAWALAGAFAAPAPYIGRGDSLVVIARKT